MRRLQWLGLGLLLLVACAARSPLLSQEAVGRIERGVTTRQQILEQLGEPDAAAVGPRGTERWTYVRRSRLRTSRALSFWLLAPLVDLSDAIILYFPPTAEARTRVQREVLDLSFGPDGVLEDFSYERPMPESLAATGPG